jgi:hypothetical protein
MIGRDPKEPFGKTMLETPRSPSENAGWRLLESSGHDSGIPQNPLQK